MTTVVITEIKTGRIVAAYPTHIRGANFTPTERDYIDSAWEDAVADKMVDEKRKTDYSFELKEGPVRL